MRTILAACMLVTSCDAPSPMPPVDIHDAATQDGFVIYWSCLSPCEHDIELLHSNRMTMEPTKDGGLFWMYVDDEVVAGGQLVPLQPECWTLKFAGQPIRDAQACLSWGAISGTLTYRYTLFQYETTLYFTSIQIGLNATENRRRPHQFAASRRRLC